MKERDFINVIRNIIGNKYLGDDCAYLKDAGIVITQDNLVENVHFKREWYTPYQLGAKSVTVNISDVIASGAKPSYVTIGLSLTNDITTEWVSEFYKGAKSVLHGAEIVGGDITGSKADIMISVCAIGKTEGRKISSRKNARQGYKIVVTGDEHGASSAGLNELVTGGNNMEIIKSHISPVLDYEMSEFIAANIAEDYAMMDTSDGVADALFQIAEQSNTTIKVDYELIPHKPNVTKNHVLFGGEDYKLIAAVPEDFAKKIPNAIIIGTVEHFDGTRLYVSDEKYSDYNELKVYNHFGENDG